jgi:aspartate carbamoyltransferase catalytic subunit
VVFVGDLARGRTVRSLSYLLTKFPNVTQYFVAPEPLQIGQDVLEQLDAARVNYHLNSDFESVMPLADAIYMTRIQDEWDTEAGESKRIDTSRYHFRVEHLQRIKIGTIIMHPLPRRQEIDVAVDHDPRAMYWRQMRNGMWIRTALIASIFGRDDEIASYYQINLK